MRMLFTLGWRNIWRNRRRSILTILAIVFATFLTVLFRGLSTGTWEYNIVATLEMFSGYLQIQRRGFQESPSLSKSFAFPGQVESLLRTSADVTGFAPRIFADGLLSYRENSVGAAIIGIDPEAERGTSRFRDRVRSGRMMSTGSSDEIVVGYKLLENVKAKIGDTVVILAQGFDGVMGNQRFRVTGAMKFGTPEFDAMTVMMDLRAAQELLAMEGRVNVVAVAASSLAGVPAVQENLKEALRKANVTQLDALSWGEVLPELKQEMEFDLISDAIFMAVLIIVVAFGILNTVLMSVTERFREFGVSLAMGMQSSTLVRLVFLETMFMATIGVVVGGMAGHLVNVYLAYNPITFGGQLAQFYEEYGFLPQLLATTRLQIPLEAMVLVLSVSIVACLYPMRRVSKLEPLKGIRYT